MIRKLAFLPLILAMSACKTTAPPIEVRTVEVPTPVACVELAQIPAEPPLIGDQLTGDAQHDLGVVAPSALELRKWGRSLIALIVPACTISP